MMTDEEKWRSITNVQNKAVDKMCAWYIWETKGTLAEGKSKQQVLNTVVPRPRPDSSHHNRLSAAWKTAGLMLHSEVWLSCMASALIFNALGEPQFRL